MRNSKSETPTPFFSIIIATYNRAELLKRAIESLIAQTEEDWEAIIVDDESTDDTYYQISSYLKKCSKISYIRKRHGGEAQTKNEGVCLSKGTFISFLDSDDEYHPEHLKYRKHILLENPTVEFLYGGLKVLGNQYVPDRFDPSKVIHLNECVAGGTFFINRKILLSLNGFSELLLGTDSELFDRAKEAKIKMMETQIPTYMYHRETQDSITEKLKISL